MSRYPTRETPLRAKPYLGDSWVVESDDEDLYRPQETDSEVGDDDEEALTTGKATGEATDIESATDYQKRHY